MGVQLRPKYVPVAVRADAMAQLGLGVIGNIAFDRLPVILIVTNALAVHAHRQYFPQLPDFTKRSLQFDQ